LKETNLDKIKKLEIDFFQSSYGKLFEKTNEVDLNPIIRYEGHILHNLDKMLRYNDSDFGSFIKILYMIENSVSNVLLYKGSVFKFLFKDSMNNWIYLNASKDSNNVIATKALSGPWDFDK
jgi:hypothetical protein